MTGDSAPATDPAARGPNPTGERPEEAGPGARAALQAHDALPGSLEQGPRSSSAPRTYADLVRRPGHRIRTFWARVYSKADEDNIFFMAGAISFNVVVAIIPLILLVVGIAGYVVSAQVPDPVQTVRDLIFSATLPDLAGNQRLVEGVEAIIDGVLGGRRELSFVGGALLIWLSTRLVGTLRTALREVFDIAHGRGIIGGKIFDAQMVVVGGGLILLNAGITVAALAVRDFGFARLGLDDRWLAWSDQLLGNGLALASIWVLFLLIYRFLPARSVPWRTALVAATIMAVVYEAMKYLFSWYVTSVAVFSTTYGNLATLAVLFFWVHYNAIAFILAGEIAQVTSMRRAWKYRPVVAGSLDRGPDGAGERGAG